MTLVLSTCKLVTGIHVTAETAVVITTCVADPGFPSSAVTPQVFETLFQDLSMHLLMTRFPTDRS